TPPSTTTSPLSAAPKKRSIVSCARRWTPSSSATSSLRVHESAHPAARVAAKILRELPGRMLVSQIMNSPKKQDCHSERSEESAFSATFEQKQIPRDPRGAGPSK